MRRTGTEEGLPSRWLNWQPQGRIFDIAPRTEPTKPTKPGFDGFVGSTLSTPQNISRHLDGHVVAKVRWATNAMIVFNDEEGATWRYLHAWKKSWPVSGLREPGLEKMREAWRQVSEVWGEVEANDNGDNAWEWILRASPHGPQIRAAEDRVDKVGSTGDPTELTAACFGLVNAWREGIEGWKRANGNSKATQKSFNLDRINEGNGESAD